MQIGFYHFYEYGYMDEPNKGSMKKRVIWYHYYEIEYHETDDYQLFAQLGGVGWAC